MSSCKRQYYACSRGTKQQSCSHYNAFCSIAWQTRMRTGQKNMTTIMQPLQCDLQPQIPQTHSTTQTHKHTQSNLKPQLQCGKKNVRSLYTRKHRVSRSGFLPNTSPMQPSCSHYNAFCSITWQTHMYLCTWQQNMTTIMQPLHCDLQPLLLVTTSLSHHPSSPSFITSLSHHPSFPLFM